MDRVTQEKWERSMTKRSGRKTNRKPGSALRLRPRPRLGPTSAHQSRQDATAAAPPQVRAGTSLELGRARIVTRYR